MAITVVQSIDGNGAGTTFSVTLPNPVGANNLLVIESSYMAGTVNPTIAGNNNTFVRRGVTSATGLNATQWDVLSANAGPTTITLTFSTSQTWIEIAVYEVNTSDGQPWNYEAGSQSPNSGTSGTPSTGAIGPAVPNEIFIAYACPQSGTITAGNASWNYVSTAGGGGRQYIINTTLTNRTGSFSASNSLSLWVVNGGGWYPTPAVPTVLAQQSATNAPASTATPTIAFPYQVTVGDLLVLFFNWGNTSGAISGVTDNLGNTWTQIDFQQVATRTLYCYAAPVTVAGNCTVTVTTDAARAYLLSAYEVVTAKNTLDGTPVHNSSATAVTTLPTGTLATAAPNSIIFAASRGGPISASPASPWTNQAAGALGTTFQVGAAGNYSTSWSFTSSVVANTILAFLAAAIANNLRAIENTGASKPAAHLFTTALTTIENTSASTPAATAPNRASGLTAIENTAASSPILPAAMILSDLPKSFGQLATPSIILIQPQIKAISYRDSWKDTQPTQPTGGPTNNPNDPSYNWTFFDAAIAQATACGKLASFHISTNGTANQPPWLKTLANQFIDIAGDSMGVPWDTNYQNYIIAFIQAMGARYGSNPNLYKWSTCIASTGSDWTVPHATNGNWTNSASFACPAFGAQVNVPTTVNSGMTAGQYCFIPSFGWFYAKQNATTVNTQLVNAGFAGNASSGTIAASTTIQVSDIANWTSPAYNYTTAKLVNACIATINAARTAFPTAKIQFQVGTTNGLDPYPGAQNYNYNAATQIAQQEYAAIPKAFFGLDRDGFNPQIDTTTQALNKQDNSGWYLLAQPLAGSTNTSGTTGSIPIRGEIYGQFDWPAFDPTGAYSAASTNNYLSNGGVAYTNPTPVVNNTIAVANQYNVLLLEIYEQDVQLLTPLAIVATENTGASTPAARLPVASSLTAIENTAASSPAVTLNTIITAGTLTAIENTAASAPAAVVLNIRAGTLTAIENTAASAPPATAPSRASNLTAIENTAASSPTLVLLNVRAGVLTAIENTGASIPAATAPNRAAALTAIENTKASSPTASAPIGGTVTAIEFTKASAPAAILLNIRAGTLTAIENSAASTPSPIAAFRAGALTAIENTATSSPAAVLANIRAGTLTAIENTKASIPPATAPSRATNLTAIENTQASSPTIFGLRQASNLTAIENSAASSPAATNLTVVASNLTAIEHTTASSPTPTAPNRALALTAIENTAALAPPATAPNRASALTAVENTNASSPTAILVNVRASALTAIENTRASSPAASAITLAQSADAHNALSSISIALPNPVIAGNQIIIGVIYTVSATISVSGNGNTYNHRLSCSIGGNLFEQLFDCLVANPGATTITVSCGGVAQGFLEVTVYEFNSSVGQWAFDNTIYDTGSSVNPQSRNLTPKQPNELFFAYCSGTTTTVNAGTSGWNFVKTGGGCGREYLALSSVAPNNATFTLSASDNWVDALGGWYPTVIPPLTAIENTGASTPAAHLLNVVASPLTAVENTNASSPAATAPNVAGALTGIENTKASSPAPSAAFRAISLTAIENTKASTPAAILLNIRAGTLTAVENTGASTPVPGVASKAGTLTAIENTRASSPAITAPGGVVLVAVEHTKASSPTAIAGNQAVVLTAIEKTAASSPTAKVPFTASPLAAFENTKASSAAAFALGAPLRAIENTQASSPRVHLPLAVLTAVENTAASSSLAILYTNPPIMVSTFRITVLNPTFTVKEIFS